jgi:hypothetical protein
MTARFLPYARQTVEDDDIAAVAARRKIRGRFRGRDGRDASGCL